MGRTLAALREPEVGAALTELRFGVQSPESIKTRPRLTYRQISTLVRLTEAQIRARILTHLTKDDPLPSTNSSGRKAETRRVLALGKLLCSALD